jgi:hydroxyacylglutathione hydrolase
MESSCFLLYDESGLETALFTGDTLFIGDVGRPDLAQHVNADLTQEKLASFLYDSLRSKILPLPAHLIIYPAHGAGSACGKNISKETSDTLGHQKKTNYALREGLTKEEFIKELLTGLTTPPYYFPKNVLMNIHGYDSIDMVTERGVKALTINEFELLMQQDHTLVLDTRKPQEFAKSFIPNSINIGIDGNFAIWVGTLITDISQKILIVADPGREQEVVSRLARVGYDYAIGYLEGGFQTWINTGHSTDRIPTMNVHDFAETEEKNPDIQILDVRKKSEYESEHILNATNIPLDYVNNNMSQIDKTKTYYVHCAGGYRSMIFCSILKARGYSNLIDVDGGFQAIKNSGKFKITEYVCPSTML